MAYGLLGCPLHGHNAAEAGSEAEKDATAGSANAPVNVEAQASAVMPPVASSEPIHKPAGSRCAAGEIAILLQPGDETCVVECKSAAGCPAGWACDGNGVLSHNGKPGNAIQFCRIISRGKGADAGEAPTSVVDAGQATPLTHPDAGTPAKKLDVKQVSGQCAAGYRTCGAACRLTCSKDADCGTATAHCQGGVCVALGTLPCGK